MARHGEAQQFFRDAVLSHVQDECLTWPFARNQYGYGLVWHDGRLCVVSRLACELIYGKPPTPKHEAAHGCGKGHLGCVAPAHLRWATRSENKADEVIHSVHTRGARNGNAKLTQQEAESVRALRGQMPRRQIARVFGISPQSVSRIQLGQTYHG